MKRTKIVVGLITCVMCLCFLVVGVYSAITASFNLQSSISFNPEGVFVEISGQVYRGTDYFNLEPLTSDASYTLNKTMNYVEDNGNISGNFALEPWTPSEVEFLPSEKFIQYKLNFKNKSDEAISVIPSEITGIPSSIEVTEDVSHVLYIESGESANYTLNFELKTGNAVSSTTFNTSFNIQKTSEIAASQTDITYTINNGVLESISGTTPRVFVVPSEVDGQKINATIDGTSSSNNALNNLSDNTEYVIFEKGIQTLGSYTLYDYSSNIKGVAFPGIKTLNNNIFNTSSKIYDLKLDNVVSIGNNAMPYALRTDINLSSALSIGTATFSSIKSKSITINNACVLGSNTFTNCEFEEVNYVTSGTGYSFVNGNLTITEEMGSTLNINSGLNELILNVDIPNTITSIAANSFSGAKSLKSIEIPNSVTSIGSGSFSNCSFDTVIYESSGSTYSFKNGHLTINDTVTELGDNQEWAAIKNLVISITIPDSVTRIGDSGGNYSRSGLYNYTSLKSLTIPKTVTSVGAYGVAYCSNLEEVIFEARETPITFSGYDFASCTSLKNVVLPDGLTNISYNSFAGCSELKSIVIPSSVTTFNTMAFDFSGLTDLYMEGAPPTLQFSSSPQTFNFAGTLHVKNEYYNSYSSGQWGTYFTGTLTTY